MEHLDQLRSHFFQEAELYLSMYDKDLNCIDANEAFLKLFKSERKDMIGKNLCDISPDLKSNGRYDLYKEVIKTGKPIIIDDMQPHHSIGNFHFRIRAFRVGEGLGLIVKNVTDLLESIARFNYATRASNEIIYEWDITSNSIWWNEAYYELMGLENSYSFSSFDNWIKFIHPEDIENVQKNVNEFLLGNENYWSGEYRFLGRDGNVHYFAERAFIIRDKMGKPIKKIASVTDITHWQLNINHLEHILFALSHKVRLPVANIIGISNLLDNDLIDEQELKTITGYMKDSVDTLEKFIREMTSLVSEHKISSENKNWS